MIPVPLSTAEGIASHAERHVLCPVCKFNYTHIHSVCVHQKDSLDIIGPDGHAQIKGTRADLRGSAVEVKMWCEDGHARRRNTG